MHPKLIPVVSESLSGYRYIPKTCTMVIAFKGTDSTYAYENATSEVFADFNAASSKGSHVQRVFVKQPSIFPCTKLDDAALDALLNGSPVAPAHAVPATNKHKCTIDWAEVVARVPIMRNAF